MSVPRLDFRRRWPLHGDAGHSGRDAARRLQIEYRYTNGSAICITLYFTPQTDRSTHVFATLHAAGRWAPRWLVRWLVWPWLHRVAQQDQAVIEEQQRLREFFPGRRAVVTPLDIVRPYLESAWDGRESHLPAEVNRVFYL